jgi:hypothetical protein
MVEGGILAVLITVLVASIFVIRKTKDTEAI